MNETRMNAELRFVILSSRLQSQTLSNYIQPEANILKETATLLYGNFIVNPRKAPMPMSLAGHNAQVHTKHY